MFDLDSSEDSVAEIDLSIVGTADGRLIEVGGGAEKKPFTGEQFTQMVAMGQQACADVIALQKQALGIE